jgi:hypothetical protein
MLVRKIGVGSVFVLSWSETSGVWIEHQSNGEDVCVAFFNSAGLKNAIVVVTNKTSLTNVSEEVFCYGVYAAFGKNQVPTEN